jgi:hypothetical protein
MLFWTAGLFMFALPLKENDMQQNAMPLGAMLVNRTANRQELKMPTRWFFSPMLVLFFLLLGNIPGTARADLAVLAPLPAFSVEHSTTLLADGRVLVAGGKAFRGSTGVLATTAVAFTYDPVSNKWANAQNLLFPRARHASLRLKDGRVMLFGGVVNDSSSANQGAVSSAEIHNPQQGTVFATAKPPSALCVDCRAQLLPDGRALFFGGSTTTGTPNYAFELYNPANNTWSQLGNNVFFQGGSASVVLLNGKLLTVGNIFNNSYPSSGSETAAYLFDIATNTSTPLPSAFPAVPNSGFVGDPLLVQLPDGKVLAAMGTRTYQTAGASALGGSTAASIFDPASNSWRSVASAPTTQTFSNTNAVATLLTNDVVAFMKIDTQPSAVFYYRISTNTWINGGLLAIPAASTNINLAIYPNSVAGLSNGELIIPHGLPTSLLRNNLVATEPVVTGFSGGINRQARYEAVVNFPFTGILETFAFSGSQPAAGVRLQLEYIAINATSQTPTDVVCTQPPPTDSAGRSAFSCVAGAMTGDVSVRIRQVNNNQQFVYDQIQLRVLPGSPPPPATFPPATAQVLSTLAGTAGVLGGGVVNDVALTGRTFNTGNVITDRDGNIFFTNVGGLIYCISGRTGRLFTIGGIGSATAGTNGFSGDGGLATLAAFNNPTGLVFDAAGNLYIADTGNNRVRRINLVSGIVTTIAGGGSSLADNIQGTTALLNAPRSLAFGPDGLLYIADGSNRIRRLNITTGLLSYFAGTGTAGYGGDNGTALAASFNDIYYITFDFQGNLFIVDRGNNRIRCITRAGIVLPVAGTGAIGFGGDGGLALNALFSDIRALAFDFWGQLYIVDGGNSRIRRLNLLTGVISTYSINNIGNSTFNAYGLFFDSLGSLITAELGQLRAVRFIDNPGYAFSFPTRARIAAGTQALSDVRSFTGFTGTVTLGIDGGEYNIGCSAANPFVSGITTLTITNPPQTVCLRVTAGIAAGDARTATFRVNNTASPFTVLTLDPDLLPRYRIYVPSLKRHLYTTDTNEYNVLTGFATTYSGEGINHYLYRTQVTRAAQSAIPYYRMYFNPQQRHFYTSDFNEYDTIRKDKVFASDEGITGYIFPRYGVPGTTALYRLYNPAINSHLWTTDNNEFTFLRSNGWTAEGQPGNAAGVDGYVFP